MTPGVQPYYSYTLADEKGKIIKKSRLLKCKSFTRNFMALIQMGLTGKLANFYNSGGVNHPQADWYTTAESVNGYTGYKQGYDIIIGGDTRTPAITDNWLYSQISTLTAAGLSIGAVQTTAAVPSDIPPTPGTNYYDMSKVFTNTTGSPVNVNEIGLYVRYLSSYSYIDWYFLLIRDVLPGTVTVANGQTMTLKYTIRAVI